MGELHEDAKKGRLPGLRALRDSLTETIDRSDTTPAERASLAGRLMACLEQIEQLERATRTGSIVDELGVAREARNAGTPGPRRAVGHRQHRGSGGGGAR